MREIKFRGFDDLTGNGWVYGDFSHGYYGNECLVDEIIVDEKTVGQFTGLSDVDGREIYEGDVIKLDNEVYIVSWAKYSACWFVDLKNFGPSLFTQYHAGKSIVVGNFYDNPELLERKS